ncbi:MAG TPA: YihY/virulence factor BrkB family protein [Acidocella sp.]|nr:YihY/virulence factor BrkB family protein [Acidocella sp.]
MAKSSLSSAATGAGATSPAQIPPKGWWHVLKRSAAGFSDDRVMTEAAGVTFYVLLSLFPALAAFIAIYGLFNNASTLGGQLAGLGGIVPGGGIDIIKGQITALTAEGHKALGVAFIIGLAISLWSANSGVKSLFDALNTIYHEREKRSFLQRTLISFGFTLGIIGFVIIALSAVVAVPIVLNFIGLGSITRLAFSILRWPFMLIVIMIGLAFVYRYGPSRNLARWQWVSWGSAIAAIVWICASLAFSYYVANFGSYNKTYGSLGAVVGFMTWIWISSIVILMGAELNAELEQQTQRDSTIGAEKPKGTRGAYKADVKSED